MAYPEFGDVNADDFAVAAQRQLALALAVPTETFKVANFQMPLKGQGVVFDITVVSTGDLTAIEIADSVVKYLAGLADSGRRLVACGGSFVFCGATGKPQMNFAHNGDKSFLRLGFEEPTDNELALRIERIEEKFSRSHTLLVFVSAFVIAKICAAGIEAAMQLKQWYNARKKVGQVATQYDVP